MTAVLVGTLAAFAVLLPSSRARRLRALAPRAGVAAWLAAARKGSAKRRASEYPDVPLALDLLAAALASGVSSGAALAATGDAVGGVFGRAIRQVGQALLLGASPEAAWEMVDRGFDDRDPIRAAVATIRRQLELCLSAGFGIGVVLHAGADAERRRVRRDREARAARLGVRMVLPLGVCVLPAFVAFGVAPVVYALSVDFLR